MSKRPKTLSDGNQTSVRLALLVALVWSGDLLADGFRAEGSFSCSTFRDSKLYRKSERQFSVMYQDEKWSIRTSYLYPTNGVDYFEASFDGSNIYYLTKYTRLSGDTPGQNSGANLNTTSRAQNDSFGAVTKGEMPKFDISFIQAIWFVYASGNFFNKEQPIRTSSILGIGGVDDLRETFLQLRATHSSSALNLPVRFSAWNEGKRISFALPTEASRTQRTAQNAILVDAQPPYNHGFTNAIYDVAEHTEVSGFLIPRTFSFLIFTPKHGGKSSDELDLSVRIEGSALRVDRSLKPVTLPDTSARTFVMDKRLNRGSSTPTYWLSNENWLDEEQAQKKLGSRRVSNPGRRFAVSAILVIGLIGPAVFLGRWAFSKNKQQP